MSCMIIIIIIIISIIMYIYIYIERERDVIHICAQTNTCRAPKLRRHPMPGRKHGAPSTWHGAHGLARSSTAQHSTVM